MTTMGRRKKGDPVSGWIVLDKPGAIGSTQAVSRLRRAFNAQKAGHAGTLDPLASGILPIALGEATKTVPFLMDAEKTYRFTIAWGVETASFDREGAITATSGVRPSPEAAAQALEAFVGEIDQVPPAFSAIKIDGERSYDLARAGIAVALKGRKVVIHRAEVVTAPDADHLELEIDCGKGVYVRAIARDLAAALGAHGHVSTLRRLRVGPFHAERAVTLEFVERMCHTGHGLEVLLPVETALDDIPALAVTTEDAFRLSQGRPILLLPRQVETLKARLAAPNGAGFAPRTVLATHGGVAVSICEMRAGQLSPTRVFNL
jgi:tRNA pseudouridine55 synthase